MITTPSYVADFETIDRNGKQSVWLWDICNIMTLKHKTGTALSDFISTINNIEYGVKIYFHNLKFDMSYIFDFLLENGYEFKNVEVKKLRKFQFNAIITEFGQFMQVVYKNRNGKYIYFIDSLKLFPVSAEKLAKDLKLPVQKGEINYNKKRDYDYMPDENEISYIHNDTEIISYALRELLQAGHNMITLSSCAYKDYKKIIGQTMYTECFGWWEKNATLELDQELREAYRGGICQVNKHYANKTVKQPVWYNDVNSLYPYTMSNFPLPYGEPVKFEGRYQNDDKHPYYIQKIKIDMTVKTDGIPCILNKSDAINGSYIVDTCTQAISGGSAVYLTVTNFDLELIYKNYNILHIEFLGGYKFKVRNDMFTDYVDKYFTIKEQSTLSCNWSWRLIAKLFLNSLYGKFGQNPVRRKKLPYMDIDGVVKFEKSEKEVANKFKYLPVAIFVTAIARHKIVNDILSIGVENWVYSDTDSILSLCPLDSEQVDDKELGKYKVEQIFKKCRVLGPKTYWGINTRGVITAKACGCTQKALKNFPLGKFNFNGTVRNGRTTLVTAKGGKKLDFNNFTIRPKLDKFETRQINYNFKDVLSII